MRQLLDLQRFWTQHDYFFVTEDIALGRSVAADHRTRFVDHVALGQARLGSPLKMLLAAFRNAWASVRICIEERPDLVITTGAGSVFFTVLFARLMGAKIIVIDSFARFDGRSAFAKVAGPFAHVRIAQSESVHREWPRSYLFDPFRIVPVPDNEREPLAFVTVGATLPFDRLVTLAAEARRTGALTEKVLMQVGIGGVRPADADSVETLPYTEVQAILKKAEIVICHGGTGSLITALQQGCRVIAIPRRFAQKEHCDDHQVEVVTAFVSRGLIQTVDTIEELEAALVRARASPRRAATTDPAALIAFLDEYTGKLKIAS